jgi:hypothetical protein
MNGAENKERRTGFLLIELLAIVCVVIAYMSVLLLACARTSSLAAQTRLLHGALWCATNALDQTLYHHKVPGAYTQGPYRVHISVVSEPGAHAVHGQRYCVEVTWQDVQQKRRIMLESAQLVQAKIAPTELEQGQSDQHASKYFRGAFHGT